MNSLHSISPFKIRIRHFFSDKRVGVCLCFLIFLLGLFLRVRRTEVGMWWNSDTADEMAVGYHAFRFGDMPMIGHTAAGASADGFITRYPATFYLLLAFFNYISRDPMTTSLVFTAFESLMIPAVFIAAWTIFSLPEAVIAGLSSALMFSLVHAVGIWPLFASIAPALIGYAVVLIGIRKNTLSFSIIGVSIILITSSIALSAFPIAVAAVFSLMYTVRSRIRRVIVVLFSLCYTELVFYETLYDVFHRNTMQFTPYASFTNNFFTIAVRLHMIEAAFWAEFSGHATGYLTIPTITALFFFLFLAVSDNVRLKYTMGIVLGFLVAFAFAVFHQRTGDLGYDFITLVPIILILVSHGIGVGLSHKYRFIRILTALATVVCVIYFATNYRSFAGFAFENGYPAEKRIAETIDAYWKKSGDHRQYGVWFMDQTGYGWGSGGIWYPLEKMTGRKFFDSSAIVFGNNRPIRYPVMFLVCRGDEPFLDADCTTRIKQLYRFFTGYNRISVQVPGYSVYEMHDSDLELFQF